MVEWWSGGVVEWWSGGVVESVEWWKGRYSDTAIRRHGVSPVWVVCGLCCLRFVLESVGKRIGLGASNTGTLSYLLCVYFRCLLVTS